MERKSRPMSISEYSYVTYNTEKQLYQINYKKEDYYNFNGKVEDQCYVTYLEFFQCPNSIELKAAISEQFDIETRELLVNGFTYRRKLPNSEEREDKFYRIYLSPENQSNFLQTYILAKNIPDSSILPYKIKCGDGYTIEYLEITSIDEFEDLLVCINEHIRRTQEEGWKKKDEFDYSKFDIAARQKYQELFGPQTVLLVGKEKREKEEQERLKAEKENNNKVEMSESDIEEMKLRKAETIKAKAKVMKERGELTEEALERYKTDYKALTGNDLEIELN